MTGIETTESVATGTPEATAASGKTEAEKLAAKLAAAAELKQRDFPKMADPADVDVYTVPILKGLAIVSGEGMPSNPSRFVLATDSAPAIVAPETDFNLTSYWGNADYTVVDCVYGTFGYGAPRGIRGMKSIPAGAVELPARVLSAMRRVPTTGWDKGPLWAEWQAIGDAIKADQTYADYIRYARLHLQIVAKAIADYDNATASAATGAGADPIAQETARAEFAFYGTDPAAVAARTAIYLYSSTISPWTRVLGYLANSPLQVVRVKPNTKKRAAKLAARMAGADGATDDDDDDDATDDDDDDATDPAPVAPVPPDESAFMADVAKAAASTARKRK